MKRRAFIAGLGSAAAWPLVARAQQRADKVWRVGYLSPGTSVTNAAYVPVIRGCFSVGWCTVFKMPSDLVLLSILVSPFVS